VAIIEGPRQAERAALLAKDKSLIVKIMSRTEVEKALRRGKVFLAVGGDDAIVYTFDPSRPDAQSMWRRINDELQEAAGRRDPLSSESRDVAVKGARYIDFLIPGLLGMNLMSASMWGIGWAIVQTRLRKLLKRMLATPMRKRDYLLAQILGRMLFLPFEVGTVLLFAWLVFDVSVQGSWLSVSLICLMGAMSFAGIGLLVASRALSSEVVSGLMNLVMFPMFIFSGVFFSAENFPDWMQPVIKMFPLTALNDALRAVMNEGATLASQAVPLGVMLLWGILSFAIALKIFRWN
jgi:ABC-type multidrug transport system permease subunit